MKRLFYILLAGLAAAGLASCDKQDLKPSVSDIYAVEIEEDILQTKASSFDIENGSSRTFYVTLKKSSDGGSTWTYVSHSDWYWGELSNCTKGTSGTATGHKASGVISGKCEYTAKAIGSSSFVVKANATSAGNIDKQVSVTVLARKRTVTFNFTPNTSRLLTLMQNKYGTTSGSAGKAAVSCSIDVTDGSGNALGSAGLADFYQYTYPSTTLVSIKSMSSATKDERVLSLQVKIEEGKKLIFKFPIGGKIEFTDGDNINNQSVSVSQGLGSGTEYYISSVQSDLTINVTTPN